MVCAVLAPFPFLTGTMFGAPIFLFLGARKGDRGLLLVLPVVVSILPIGLIAIVVRAIPGGQPRVVAEAAAGEPVTITDRGRPVAGMTAVPSSCLEGMIEDGLARPARRAFADLPAPEPGPDVSKAREETRADER